MIRKHLLAVSAAATLALGGMQAQGAEVEHHVEDIHFSFETPFGTYDPHQLQRGLQVYKEICSACHGLKLVAFRNLGDPGGPELPPEQVKAFAALYEFEDPETGETVPGKPTDHFPAVTDAGAPDLSLMAKARAAFHGPMGLGLNQLFKGTGGPEHIYSILTGFRDAPDCAADTEMDGNYNIAFASGAYPDSCKIFEEVEKEKVLADGTVKTVIEKKEVGRMVPGSWIAMAPPLAGEDVEYADGTPATLEQEAEDVAAFLMWAAEPKMTARKEAGLTAVLFLIVLTVLLYYTNKKLWAPIKRKPF